MKIVISPEEMQVIKAVMTNDKEYFIHAYSLFNDKNLNKILYEYYSDSVHRMYGQIKNFVEFVKDGRSSAISQYTKNFALTELDEKDIMLLKFIWEGYCLTPFEKVVIEYCFIYTLAYEDE